jgi:hypothetical protein
MNFIKMFPLILSIGLVSCAQTEVKKEVEQEASQEVARPMHGPTAAKGMSAITNSPSLKPKQKEEFMKLHAKVMKDTFRIQDEISKYKSVLFQTIVEVPYNPTKMNEIKKKLVALNDEKMANMFDALTEVQRIMGYMPPEERREFIRDFINVHERIPAWK